MGYLEAINRRLSSPTFIIIGGRGSRICAHSFQFYSTRSPHPLSHRGEEESEGWRARFQLSRLKSSAVRALGFSASISASRSTIPEMHTNCDGPACIIYRTETGPALRPKMDGIIRVCATACSSPPPTVGISIEIPTNLDQYFRKYADRFLDRQKRGQFLPSSDN